MPELVKSGLTVLVTLTVTFLFNYFVGLPKKKKKQKDEQQKEKQEFISTNTKQNADIKKLREELDALKDDMKKTKQCMHQADKDILDQLNSSSTNILALCKTIQENVAADHNSVMDKLRRLEIREKNRIRAALIREYNLFTNPQKNPMLAWSEMEHDAFFKQVDDYEDLKGNDYIHSEVLPAMNKLTIIPMTDVATLESMFKLRSN